MAKLNVIHGPTYSVVEALGYPGGLDGLVSAVPDRWPDIIEAVNAGYAEAGADPIVTATWGTTPGRDLRNSQPLSEQHRRVAEVVRVGLAVAGSFDLRAVASIAPLGDCYGKEARHFIGPKHPTSASVQRAFLESIIRAGVQDVILEAFPSTEEIDLAGRAAEKAGARVVGISVFCQQDPDGVLRLPRDSTGEIGTSLAEVARQYDQADGFPHLEVFAANCIDPRRAVLAATTISGAVDRVAVGVWPNSLANPDALDGSGHRFERTDPERQALARIIGDCITAGASWVGGCCGTDERDVASIRAFDTIALI